MLCVTFKSRNIRSLDLYLGCDMSASPTGGPSYVGHSVKFGPLGKLPPPLLPLYVVSLLQAIKKRQVYGQGNVLFRYGQILLIHLNLKLDSGR